MEWSHSISLYMAKALPNVPNTFMTQSEVLNLIAEENLKNINKTWFYLIILECTLFIPYTALGKSNDKLYSKLKYKRQEDFLKEFVRKSGIIDESFIDRVNRTYSKSISKLTGKVTKNALKIVSIIAAGALTFGAGAAFAGKIAVAIYGSQFAGLSGAALTSACLAMAGGGAIAAGGAGMAGGMVVIAGGGALLGLAGGGAAVGGISLLMSSDPQLTLTQAAKLEVVLKEIVINVQKDIVNAQKVLDKYRKQIVNLQSQLADIRLRHEKDKKTIENMKKSIDYMEKAYKNTVKFVSSYELGIGQAN